MDKFIILRDSHGSTQVLVEALQVCESYHGVGSLISFSLGSVVPVFTMWFRIKKSAGAFKVFIVLFF